MSNTNFVEILKICENAKGGGSKKIIHDAIERFDDIAKRLIVEIWDYNRTWGVRKYDDPKKYAEVDPDWNIIFPVLDKLASRELSGNAAREAVTNLLSCFTEDSAKYVSRIINKDPRAGFSAETFNKKFPNAVPIFNVMLATKFDSDEDVRANVTYPIMLDPKLDGERCIIIVKGQNVVYLSRSGLEAHHLQGLFDEDAIKIRDTIGYDVVLDGERMAGSFTETMNAKREGNLEAKENLRFHCFYYMSYLSWINKNSPVGQYQNRLNLIKLLEKSNVKKILAVDFIIANNYEEMYAYYQLKVNEGYEGLIIKRMDANYIWDRDKNAFIKWKPFFDFDGKIVGFYPGNQGKKRENTLGGIIVEGYDEQGRFIRANCANGFKDGGEKWQRDHIWNNQAEYLNISVTLSYQEISKAVGSDHYSLRFVTFLHVRDDK